MNTTNGRQVARKPAPGLLAAFRRWQLTRVEARIASKAAEPLTRETRRELENLALERAALLGSGTIRMRGARVGLLTAALIALAVGLVAWGIADDLAWEAFVNNPANGCSLIGRKARPTEPTLHVETWVCNGAVYHR